MNELIALGLTRRAKGEVDCAADDEDIYICVYMRRLNWM